MSKYDAQSEIAKLNGRIDSLVGQIADLRSNDVTRSMGYNQLDSRLRQLEKPAEPRLIARFVGGPLNGQERAMTSLPLAHIVPLPMTINDAYNAARYEQNHGYTWTPKIRSGRYVWIAKGYEGHHVGIYEYRGEC